MKQNIKEISVREYGHTFTLAIVDSGKVEYRIDNGETFTAKKLKDGKVYFVKKQEIVAKDELLTIDGLDLSESDFAILKEAQDAILAKKQEQFLRKFTDEPKEVSQRVDSWKRKIIICKDENKVKQKCYLHTFRIGNNKYKFVERSIPGVGVVVNPDYKVSEDVPFVGGIAKQHGELIFWEYLYPDKGWERVRTLTNNEIICLDIIRKYGFYADRHVES